jgi:hypothetical protein
LEQLEHLEHRILKKEHGVDSLGRLKTNEGGESVGLFTDASVSPFHVFQCSIHLNKLGHLGLTAKKRPDRDLFPPETPQRP